MPALPLVLGWFVLAAGAPAPSAATGADPGYRPSGAPTDLHDLGRLARLRAPGVRPFAFASDFEAHRGAGRLRPSAEQGRSQRAEHGNSPLAELSGPGIIQHIRIGPTDGNARLVVHLDGRPAPALDLSLDELASGRHPHFPRPLVGSSGDGFASDVPIAFRDGCRVTLEGQSSPPPSFEVRGVTLPDADGLATFNESPGPAVRDGLERARALWSHPSDARNLGLDGDEAAEYRVEAVARSTQIFGLPDGPRTVRSFEVRPEPGTADAWRSARLRLTWDGDEDEPDAAGVDLTFADAFEPDGSPSVLAGRDGATFYQHAPMPYRRRALLRIDGERPMAGTVRLLTVRGVAPDVGYFRGAMRPDRLDEPGRGLFLGAFPARDGRDRPAVRIPVAFDGRPMPDASPTARWHLADPVPFARSFEAGSRAVVFWYSEQPGPARARAGR